MRGPEFWSSVGEFFAKQPLGADRGRFMRGGIVFSVDGLEDTNHIYRRGVKWEKLFANMKAYSETGAMGIWEFLIFDHNKHQVEAQLLPFIQHDLTKPVPVKADYGYCTDVMEHIEPENVDKVLTNIMSAVNDCFFQISTVPDVMGALIGQDLHLTVKPLEWWEQKFISLGFAVLWRRKIEAAALFFVTRSLEEENA